ncbi:MAG TPA: hypothetical protein DEF61_05235 [Firmicutes bacterium]|nr:hypothetical protein [Bacillota bacterium]
MDMAFKQRLTYINFFIRNIPAFLKYKIFKKPRNLSHFCGENGINLDYTNLVLNKALSTSSPFCAIRFGAVELSCLNNHEKIELGFKHKYKDSVIYSMKNNAGFFPPTQKNLQKYGDTFLSILNKVDYLGISGAHMEDYFYSRYCKNATPILYEGMEPLRGDWIKKLEGKNVLVVSSFAKEIETQYKKIDLIFNNERIVPKFNLMTVEAPLTLADETIEDSSFFELLSFLYKKIDSFDYDIALIGAGAYGSFLAIHCKEKGKIGIQTGGATPTMFGIMGKRWENRTHVSKYVNSYWIRPSRKPKGYEKIEKGAYW